MPRTTKVVIRPNVDQTERVQNIDGLVQQFKQYYRQTREESLKKLVVTLEDQAFRHAETRDQYSYNLDSLSSKEFEKATKLHAEINARVRLDEIATSQFLFTDMNGTDTTREAKALYGDVIKDEDIHSEGVSSNGKKSRQQMARQRIMTRRRKRDQSAGDKDLSSQPQSPILAAVEEHTHMASERTVGFIPYYSYENDVRGVKGCQIDEQDEGAGIADWIDEFCYGNVDVRNRGSSNLELTQNAFGIEEGIGIETCVSSSQSSESEGPSRKRRRVAEENCELKSKQIEEADAFVHCSKL